MAVESAFGVKAKETAVSNAVLWSQRGQSEQNINPDFDLQTSSSKLWAELLDDLNPSMVICCGNVAHSVIYNSGWGGDKVKIRLPAKTSISRVSGMFDENDLLNRYPEVKRVVDIHPEWLSGSYRRNKIFFACHAVSLNNKNN